MVSSSLSRYGCVGKGICSDCLPVVLRETTVDKQTRQVYTQTKSYQSLYDLLQVGSHCTGDNGSAKKSIEVVETKLIHVFSIHKEDDQDGARLCSYRVASFSSLCTLM
jgi:hypothetical protein